MDVKNFIDYLFNDYLAKPLPIALISLLIGHLLTRMKDSSANKTKIEEAKYRLARALWAEITALFNLYEPLKLQPWTNPNDDISFNMANIEYDYISIFNSNADKIGIYPAEDAAEFVKFYIFTKFYIDSLRELSRRWTSYLLRYEQHRLDPNNPHTAAVYNESLNDVFELYQYCYKQQAEFYCRRDKVKKTFDKYI